MERRIFLKYLATATAAFTAAPLVAACSSGDNGSQSHSAQAPQTLRIAAIGAPGEDLNISEAMSTATWAALYAVYESLVIAGERGADLQLAKSVTPNEDATSWTIELREGAKFSDGSEVTAQDVLDSLAHVANNPIHGMTYADLDVAKSTANAAARTVTLALTRPRADFAESVLGMNSLVYKGGNPATGIGSGPYVVDSGDSGQGWAFSANPHFPAERRVSEALEIQVIKDASARLRAVDSGTVDLAMDLPSTAQRSLKNAEAWSPGPADSKGLVFVLNTNVAPFDKPEVRRAFKMAIDRRKLVNTALDGVGTPGADIAGLGFADYPQRAAEAEHDVAASKKIFAEHGVTRLKLVTADFTPGMNDGADVVARQLKEAGVEVSVEKRDPSTYFADMEGLRALPLFASYFVNRPLTSALAFLTGSKGMFNLSGFGANAQWDAKLAQAQAETDPAKRQRLIDELAERWQREGGECIWGYANEIHGRAAGVPDVKISQSVPIVEKK